jgi:hypothetical protein
VVCRGSASVRLSELDATCGARRETSVILQSMTPKRFALTMRIAFLVGVGIGGRLGSSGQPVHDVMVFDKQ